MLRDPKEYCVLCDRRYGMSEESCSGCGFDPVNNEEDEHLELQAKINFAAEQNEA